MACLLSKHKSRFLLGWIIIAGPYPALAKAPPPPSAIDIPAFTKLRLELVINGATTGYIVPVELRDGMWLVQAEDLRRAHIPLAPEQVGLVQLSSLSQVEATYDQSNQRLVLTVPGEWLPHQALGSLQSTERFRPSSSFGAVLNYEIYASRSGKQQSQSSMWNDMRLFGDFGLLRNSTTYSLPLTGPGKARFTRYDTNWTYVDEERVLTYEAGDLVTRTLPWASPVRIGGLQLSRNFSVRPDIVTYPVPSFSGTASVPTAIELFINGSLITADTVQPGPYSVLGQPYVTGAGEAVIVTQDALGRSVTTAVPFYATNRLLRPGLSDYSLSVGKLRRNYGSKNFAYGAMVANSSLRHGVTDWFTLEAQAQAAPSFLQGGAGTLLRLGVFGVLDLSFSASRYTGNHPVSPIAPAPLPGPNQPLANPTGKIGMQVAAGYQYSKRGFNLSARHLRRNPEFFDLGNYGNANYRLPRQETQANAGFLLGQSMGSVSVSYIDTRFRDDRYRLISMNYSKPLFKQASLLLSANHDLERGTTTALVQFIMPLGNRFSSSAGIERTGDGQLRKRLNASQSLPSDGGIGWNGALTHDDHSGLGYQANAIWRSTVAQVQAGVSHQNSNLTLWSSVSGSAVLMDGDLFATNRISDAFVVVTTDGVADIPVFQENQRIGITGRSGRLLIPSVSAYYGARYTIDPFELPGNISIPVVEQRAAVKLGSGRIVRFPIRQTVSVTVRLHTPDGEPVAVGSPVTTDSGGTGFVGWDGVVYLEDAATSDRITATLPDGSHCAASYALPAEDSGTHNSRIGPLICQ